MGNSIGYTQRHHQEKQDIKVQKLGSHWKLRDQNEAVVNQIYIAMVATSSKEIQWTSLLRNINDLERSLRNQRSHCKADMTLN